MTQNITTIEPSIDLSYMQALGFDVSQLKPKRSKGRPRGTTPEQEIAIVKLVHAGYSIPSIAHSIGLSAATVSSIVERNSEALEDL